MPKPEILDPQGKAVTGALGRLGFSGIAVRQGKRFEIEVDGEVTADRLADIERAAEHAAGEHGDRDLRRPRRGRDRGHRRRGRADRARRHRPPRPRPRRPERRDGAPDGPEDRRRHLPRLARRPRRAAGRPRSSGAEAVALWHGSDSLDGVDAVVLPGGFSYGDYLRCGAIARFAPVMDEVDPRGRRRDAGARHLQRLPDPVRGAPAAGRPDPQRRPHLRLPRPAAAGRVDRHGLDQPVRGRPGDRDRAQERRGRLRRRRRDPRAARGRGPRRVPLRRRQPERLAERHRRHHATSAATWSV